MTSYYGNGMEMPKPTNGADFGPLNPGNGLKGKSPVCHNPEELCHGRVNVIYCRFSSDMQRKESNENQARYCREYLQRNDLGHLHFFVINDEEISGTKADRPGWDRVMRLIMGRRLGMLIVYDVSRMDRGDNAVNFVRDIDSRAGRFISASEYIDTDRDGWEEHVRTASAQASGFSGMAARRTRNAQSGVARTDELSSGARTYGYTSEFVASEAARSQSRHQRHEKKVLIDQKAADVVKNIFDWFVLGGLGISEIVKELVKLGDTIPVPGRKDRYAWNRGIIRYMLANSKYKGLWVWGRTKTVRDGRGNKSHAPAKPENIVYTPRSHLQIVDTEIFERAEAILAEFKQRNGNRPGGKKRGPAAHFRLLHERTLIIGLIYCSGCGARLHVSGGNKGKVRLACPNNHDFNLCDRTVGILAAVAEAKVAEVIGHALNADPAWVPLMMAKMTNAVARATSEIPSKREQLMADKAKVNEEISNAKDAVRQGKGIKALVELLAELEAKQQDLIAQLAQLKPMPDPRTLPLESWLRDELVNLPALLKAGDPVTLGLVRSMIGRIEVDQVLAPGKKRGYPRLRFTLNLPGVAEALLRRKLPLGVSVMVPPLATSEGVVEFVVDLGKPTNADNWAAQIDAWRQESPPVEWKEICRRTGLHHSTAMLALNRHRASLGDGPLAA